MTETKEPAHVEVSTERAIEIVLGRVRMPGYVAVALSTALDRERRGALAPLPDIDRDALRAVLLTLMDDLSGTHMGFQKSALMNRIDMARAKLKALLDG